MAFLPKRQLTDTLRPGTIHPKASAAAGRVEPRKGFASALENTGPDELKLAATRELDEFMSLYGDTMLLLVVIRDTDKELGAGLSVTALRDEANVAVEPVSRTLVTPREELEATSTGLRTRRFETEMGLLQVLSESRHCVVPLRKRITAEALSPHRITIGRAPNKDIVLRHESISKYHAWIEMDESGTFFVADAESKNGTWLNGSPVPEDGTPMRPSDRLRFGVVEATLCSPEALWRTLSLAARRMG
jgi:hypothetical protein